MGLHIMDYRARSIGAALRIASRPEGGNDRLLQATRGQLTQLSRSLHLLDAAGEVIDFLKLFEADVQDIHAAEAQNVLH